MTRRPPDWLESELEAREREVLKSIIRQHIVTGEPVGSRTVSRGLSLDLSPATIRNIMGELGERGLLDKPHKSAGRVPTDRAYRVYVDRLMRRPRLSSGDAEAIDLALGRSRGEIHEMLEEASRQLSKLSHHVAVVLAPELSRIVVEHVEFIRLAPRRVVAIVVGRSGVVHNRILDLERPLREDEVERAGRQLSELYAGKTLPQMRDELARRLTEERATYDRLMRRALELGSLALGDQVGEAELIVDGTSNLVGSPEFHDADRMRALLQTLEDKGRLVDLMGRMLEQSGPQVVIGSENPVDDLADCSIITSSYTAGGRVLGTVGLVGPKRMEYARGVALVDYLAQVLSRLLSTTEDG